MSPMLEAESVRPVPDTLSQAGALGSIDLRMMQAVMAIERGAGQSESDAREAALALLGVRERATAKDVRIEPPLMTSEAFQEKLAVVTHQLEAMGHRPAAVVRPAL